MRADFSGCEGWPHKLLTPDSCKLTTMNQNPSPSRWLAFGARTAWERWRLAGSLALWIFGLWTFNASAESPNQGLSPILTNNPIYQRDMWFWKQRAFPLSDIPTGARSRALDQIR